MNGENRKAKIVKAELEPRWPIVVALLAIGGLYLAMPRGLTVWPRWVPLAVICALLIPTIVAWRTGHYRANQFLGYLILTLVTAAMIACLVLLVAALPAHKEAPVALLRSAIALWFTNILVFAFWYWRLDAGGPHKRYKRGQHTEGAFLFPQMTLTSDTQEAIGDPAWYPHFIDYLFLAFNTSTALSPADTPILSRWAKLLVMTQATISLSVIALLGARAVNIL